MYRKWGLKKFKEMREASHIKVASTKHGVHEFGCFDDRLTHLELCPPFCGWR